MQTTLITPGDNIKKNGARIPEYFQIEIRCKYFPLWISVGHLYLFIWNFLGMNRQCINEENLEFFPFYRFELCFIDNYVYFLLKIIIKWQKQ